MKNKIKLSLLPLFAALLSSCPPVLGQEISTDYSNYAAEEEIIVTFSDGPGNPKDWVGLYKQEMVAGEDSSLAWAYVDGTETGTEGLTEGELTFADGMTDEMITVLGSGNPDRLGVIARTSSMRFKGSDESVREIAEQLAVIVGVHT